MYETNSATQKRHLRDVLKNINKEGGALLATNFYNYETLKGVLLAARELKSPVILQLTRSSIEYMGLRPAVALARAASQDYEVETWIHLDHGDSYELVQKCLDAGFDSVMIDASEKSFVENITVTSQVVKLAAQYGAQVEAELGYVAKLGQSKEKTGFTQPEEAKLFVDETGVDSLAVAIGSAHGFYTEEPKLDIALLAKIHAATTANLVLHGGSGIPHPVLREAIQNGISKINLATEIKNIFTRTLQQCLQKTEEIDLRKSFPPAIAAVTSLVKEKLEVVKPAKL
ncbi:MAG: class II fructose-bisphosphate aldolase [Chitinophagaceae bacterium]|nr:class II fructose-bisphosphate aldolase [Chitinophagaceae bacterium]